MQKNCLKLVINMNKIFSILILFFCLILCGCSNVIYDKSGALVYEVQTSITQIVEKVEGACVGITALTSANSQSLGSGVIFKREENRYYFLTNYHVISEAIDDSNSTYKVYVGSNTNSIEAHILYDNNNEAVKSSSKDLAVLYFDSDSDYQTIDISSYLESHVIKGEEVIAIGCPISLDNYNLVSTGVVSLEEYSISNNGGNVNVIQHTSTINPGNSGGALFNLKGELIGINFRGTTAVKEGESYVVVSGIYYAIAISSVKEFLNDYELI